MNFADRMDAALDRTGNPCVVGLDPHLALLPDEYAVARDATAPRKDRARAVRDFCESVLDAIGDRVPAVKPQSAFFEVFGAPGIEAWESVVKSARARGLLVIGDVKRGDIGSSAAAYAEAFLGDTPDACDAITVNPYLGGDAVKPFVEQCHRTERGLFVLVRTSNPDSSMFQLHGEPPLVDRVAAAVDAWGSELVGDRGFSSVGAVVGATHKSELAAFRAALPRTPVLLPGYGAQGAGAADVVAAFVDGLHGALVNSSRGILFAYRQDRFHATPWRTATRQALDDMIRDFEQALGT
jgi:orotidine-5'-phosphate decarboxylase